MLSKFFHLYHKKVYSHLSIHGLKLQDISATINPPTEAIRWIDSVSIAKNTKIGLFMHPDAGASFSIDVQPRMRFSASVALLPEVFEKNTGGVAFTATITAPHTKLLSKTVFVSPKNRRWVPFTLPLHRFAGQTVTMRLSTKVPTGKTGDYAWAVWGAPECITPRSSWELFRKLWQEIHRSGIRGTLKQIVHMAQVHDNAYQQWIIENQLSADDRARIKKECAAFHYKPKISIVTPVYNVDPKWLDRCFASVKAQYYQNWEFCLCDDASTRPETVAALKKYDGTDPRIKITYSTKNGGIAAASNKALSLATGEFMALLDNDDEIPPEALYEVVKLLNTHPETDMIYTDEDKFEMDGSRCDPYFKPDWSPEFILSCMYTCHFGVYRKSLVEKVGRFRTEYDKSQDYDLVLRIMGQTKKIAHIPKILYHWRKIPSSTAASVHAKSFTDVPAKRAVQDYVKRHGLYAEVLDGPIPTYQRVKYAIHGKPLVSILLPTNGKIVQTDKGEMNLLKNCLESIKNKTTWDNYEVIIGHNGNLSPETMAFVESEAKKNGRYKIVHYKYTPPFNFANKLNFIAKHARGDHFLILNDDIEVISPEWMTAMLEFSQQKEIGMVGAKLFFPDGTLQHVGVVMGIGGGASHVFTKCPGNHHGYFSSAELIRNYSVVTGACCMTRREIFEDLGGLDEQFGIDYNDVDYCLRVRESGYRVVFTPYAQLTHHESVSLGSRAGKVARPEEHLLRTRWAKVIANDPYYNPNLTLKDTNYQIRL